MVIVILIFAFTMSLVFSFIERLNERAREHNPNKKESAANELAADTE